MRIYDFVTQQCNEAGVGADTAEVQRIVGTLTVAGFGEDLQGHDLVLGKEIVSDLLSSRSRLRVARVVVTNSDRAPAGSTSSVGSTNSDDRFLEIEAYIKKGHCPRCKTPMVKVKLGSKMPTRKDFMVANYCKSCKTTLWTK